jgi:hypothetical protein
MTVLIQKEKITLNSEDSRPLGAQHFANFGNFHC